MPHSFFISTNVIRSQAALSEHASCPDLLLNLQGHPSVWNFALRRSNISLSHWLLSPPGGASVTHQALVSICRILPREKYNPDGKWQQVTRGLCLACWALKFGQNPKSRS